VVINEACAAGLPIITTPNVGAAHDLVEEGRNGYLVPPDDVSQLADRMAHFIAHPEEVARFGARSRELAEHVSVERGAKMFVSIINQLLNPDYS
jgi:glycosyltransferase involved in cell wall biosynthesis